MSASFVSGVINFSGITAPKSVTAYRKNGVRPGKAIVIAQPQLGSPDTSGTTTFTFGSSTTVLQWNNALCDLGQIVVTDRGENIQRFTVLDRRWRWSRGTPVTGAYNLRNPDGTIISSTQKTLAQLATILFMALGDPSADVSLVTSSEYVFVVYDYDDPADELASLLESRGYVISLQNDDTIKVWPNGTGATLPANDDVISLTVSIDPPEVPQNIRAICNRTQAQSMLLMVPVALETPANGGGVVLANSVSYAPAGGFDGMDLYTMAYITDPIARECALASVGRMYQAWSQATGTFDDPDYSLDFGGVNYVPGEISVTSMTQLFPLKPFLLQSGEDIFSDERYQPAFVSGTFLTPIQQAVGQGGQMPQQTTNTPPFSLVSRNYWRLLKKVGNGSIIVFKEPAQMLASDGKTKTFASVYLTCSYSIHPSTTYIKDRYTRDLNLGGYGIDAYRLNELQRTIIAEYTSGTNTISSLTDNKSSVNTSADEFLNATALNYFTENSNNIHYRDIQNFNTDGVALEVQWHVASGNPPYSTFVTQYAESLPLLVTNEQLARARRLRRLGDPDVNRNQKWLRNTFGGTAIGGDDDP